MKEMEIRWKTVATPPEFEGMSVRTSEDFLPFVANILRCKHVEEFWAFAFDAQLRPQAMRMLARGSIKATMVNARECVLLALMKNCEYLIVAHNHPPGDPTPSPQDQQATQELIKAGAVFGISLLGHLVIGDTEAHEILGNKRYTLPEEVSNTERTTEAAKSLGELVRDNLKDPEQTLEAELEELENSF